MCMKGAGELQKWDSSVTELGMRAEMVWACIHVQLRDMGYIGKNAGISGVAKIFQHVPKAREQSDQVGENEGWRHLHGLQGEFSKFVYQNGFFFFFFFLAH